MINIGTLFDEES